ARMSVSIPSRRYWETIESHSLQKRPPRRVGAPLAKDCRGLDRPSSKITETRSTPKTCRRSIKRLSRLLPSTSHSGIGSPKRRRFDRLFDMKRELVEYADPASVSIAPIYTESSKFREHSLQVVALGIRMCPHPRTWPSNLCKHFTALVVS